MHVRLSADPGVKRETLDCQSTHGVPDVNIIDRSALSRTPQSTPFIALTPTHASGQGTL